MEPRRRRAGSRLGAWLLAAVLPWAVASAGAQPPPLGRPLESIPIGPNSYARVDWDRIARVDLRYFGIPPQPRVAELYWVRGSRLRTHARISWPAGIEQITRRLAADSQDWVLLGAPGPIQNSYRQYANLDRVRYVVGVPGFTPPGSAAADLYTVGRRGARVYLGRVYLPEELRKVRRTFSHVETLRPRTPTPATEWNSTATVRHGPSGTRYRRTPA